MILVILETLTQLACLLCIVTGLRAAHDSYRCYENNTNYLAAVFFAISYLFINYSYGQSPEKVADSISIMYRLFHLCIVLFLARVCMDKSAELRAYCKVNFNDNFVKSR